MTQNYYSQPEGRWEGIMRGKGGRVFRNIQRTQGQNQRGLGSRVGCGDGWIGGSGRGSMDTTVLEQQFKKKVQRNSYK